MPKQAARPRPHVRRKFHEEFRLLADRFLARAAHVRGLAQPDRAQLLSTWDLIDDAAETAIRAARLGLLEIPGLYELTDWVSDEGKPHPLGYPPNLVRCPANYWLQLTGALVATVKLGPGCSGAAGGQAANNSKESTLKGLAYDGLLARFDPTQFVRRVPRGLEPQCGAGERQDFARELGADDLEFNARACTWLAELVLLGTTGAPDEWLTVTQAAKLLMTDVDGLDLKKAKARVSWAASEVKFRTNDKERSARRIERISFDAWRLKLRDRGLDADNEGY